MFVSNDNQLVLHPTYPCFSCRRPIATTTTTEAPMSLNESTALYVSLMASTKAPSTGDHVEEEAEHSDETTTEVVHEEEGSEEEDHDSHTASTDDLEDHTEHENILFDQRVSHDEEEDIPVEQKLRQLTDTIQNLDKISIDRTSNDDETRKSFLSLSDLIKTLRPDDAKPLQIDSAYSRSQVLGEKPDVVYHPRKTGDVSNRSLFKK